MEVEAAKSWLCEEPASFMSLSRETPLSDLEPPVLQCPLYTSSLLEGLIESDLTYSDCVCNFQ